MKWAAIGAVVVFTVVLFAVIVIGIMFVSVSNKEASLRVTIEQKQKDNTSEYDNMWKKIAQTAQVSEKQAAVLKDIFIGYADARTSKGDNATLMKWVQESVPNVNTEVFNKLMDIITSSRDSWTFRQKELLDLNREHEKMLVVFPSNIICSILGRKSINIVIVTSARTDKAFETGKDDDVSLFEKK